jgi:hypothetical protein
LSAWESDGQFTAIARAALQREFSVEGFYPVHNVRYADALSAICRFETFAVVGHAQTNKPVIAIQLYIRGRRAGMLEDIGDLFLDDAVNIQLQVSIDRAFGHTIVELCAYNGVLVEVVDQWLDQLSQVQFALGRDLVPGEEPQFLDGVIDQADRFLD